MSESLPILHDWRDDWLAKHDGHHVALLVPIDGDLSNEEVSAVRQELSDLLNEPSVGTAPFDPYTGAGGFGVAVIWEVVGQGADLFAWVTAAVIGARQIRTAAKFLVKRLSNAREATIYLSGEAIKALCVADVCESGVDPKTIETVSLLEHKYWPSEPTVEKQQLYSAYTVAISGRQADAFFHVWSFLVTCRGEVISRGNVKIPMPNASQWSEAAPKHKLTGLP